MPTQQLTAIPRSVFGPKDDRVPQHDVVCIWRRVHALRRILLEALEVPHEALRTPHSVPSRLTNKQSRAAHHAIARLHIGVRIPSSLFKDKSLFQASSKLAGYAPSWPAWT